MKSSEMIDCIPMAYDLCPFCKEREATLLCDFVIGFLWDGVTSPSHIGVTLTNGKRSSIPNPNGEQHRIISRSDPEMFTCDRPICSECSTRKGYIFFSGKKGSTESVDHCPQCANEEEGDGLRALTKEEAVSERAAMWRRSVGFLKAL